MDMYEGNVWLEEARKSMLIHTKNGLILTSDRWSSFWLLIVTCIVFVILRIGYDCCGAYHNRQLTQFISSKVNSHCYHLWRLCPCRHSRQLSISTFAYPVFVISCRLCRLSLINGAAIFTIDIEAALITPMTGPDRRGRRG